MSRTALLAFAAGLALAASAGHAQDSDAAERARIAAERSRLDAEFTQAQQQCYQKFAVTDCIDKARAKRREALADLRRQEVSLNDAQRRQRAAERLKALDERNSEAQRQRDEERRAKAQAAQQDREQRAAEKAAKAGDAASAAHQRAKPQEPRARQAPPDTAENARRYEQRVKDAEEHRAKVEELAASKAKKEVRPLPTPP